MTSWLVTLCVNERGIRKAFIAKSVFYLTFTFFLVLRFQLSGQSDFAFQYLTKKDGLSQASVFSIAQDDAGFMWFGTRDGLNKYDGYRFKSYRNDQSENSLVSNDIRTLYADKGNNALWIGSNSGLSKYESSSDHFTNFRYDPDDSESISNNVIRQIYRDSKGRLWVGTSIGLNLLDESTNTFKRFYLNNTRNPPSEENDVKAIMEDKEGTLWFGTAKGLFKLVEDGRDTFTFKEEEFGFGGVLSDSHIKALLEDNAGNIWIGTFTGGLNYWNRKDGSITTYKYEKGDDHSLSHNNIRALTFDKDENLWVGTFDGLNYLERGAHSFIRFNKSGLSTSGLSDKSVRSLLVDKQGSLWVGTYYGGINHLDKNYSRFNKHTPMGNGLRGHVVSSFSEDESGNLWIGTEGDGLKYFNQSRKVIEDFTFNPNDLNSLSGNNVKCLLLDDEHLWIGTFQAGLNLYHIQNNTFQHYVHDQNDSNSISANNVYGLLKENNLLWILTYGGGLDILDLDQNKFHNFSHRHQDLSSISSNLTRTILKTRSGQFWIGTERGLNKVTKKDNGFPLTFETYLSDQKIYCLTESLSKHIWIGTFSNGFYRFDPQKNVLEHYTKEDGLPGNTVLGILEVSHDELWISTNNGLSKFNPNSKQFTNYDYSNGLENSEYNFNAYLKDSEGDLLFGGLNGYTYFNPDAIRPNEYIPPIVFTELRRNNQIVSVGDESDLLKKSINETESIIFDYKEANFSIHFSALDFFSPNNNQYTFMLEGIDNEWNHSIGKTEATYTIQQHGEYVFRLKGGNSEGKWNSEERQLKISVLPPPWLTWWAYLIYVIVLTSLILGFYRFIKLRHNLQLEKLVNQQQAELNEVKLRFFTNITHEFRTPLTLILAPLNDLLSKEKLSSSIEDQLKTVEKNAQRMLNLVNQILTFRKLATDHTELSIVKGDIVEFLEEIHLLFRESAKLKNIDYRFESEKPSIEAWFDRDKLEKVFFNLLSNAFKFTPNDGIISLQITQNSELIEIKISDSGEGIAPELSKQIFNRFYEKSVHADSVIKGSGIGLSISKQMVELHQGKIFLANSEDHPYNKGASFIVQLRKGKKHFSTLHLGSPANTPKKGSGPKPVPIPVPVVSLVEETNSTAVTDGEFKVLIVEDNTEVRNYIKKIFSPHYHVLTAKNGIEGLDKAKEKLPDIVISDVMMPEMDGITLCQELKSDFEISHIPVMLLTARAASLFKIEGLKTGADDYITKPFNPDELLLRVRNILKSRQDMRTKFKRLLKLDPEELNITSADEIFLEKALQVVEKNIERYEFNVNQFAFDLAVSRPQLFTKLKALTGQTPNNFIKSIRMKRAAQLLGANNMNISEVAYKVGFKDVKYFSKCFKAQFDVPPSQFKNMDYTT